MSQTAPLWLCFLAQLISVVGDCIGQRTARRYMTHASRRRFVLGLVLVSSVQMFVVLTTIQLAAPAITTIIYETGKPPNVENASERSYNWCSADLWPRNGSHSENITQPIFYDGRFVSGGNGLPVRGVETLELEADGSGQTVDQERYCFDQGPLSLFKDLRLCPILLVNGLLNIVYYIGEATLYRQPLGVLFLVLTSLASSFFVAPVQKWFNLSGATDVNVWAVVCGLLGALLCLIERDPPKWSQRGGGGSSTQRIHTSDVSVSKEEGGDDGGIQEAGDVGQLPKDGDLATTNATIAVASELADHDGTDSQDPIDEIESQRLLLLPRTSNRPASTNNPQQDSGDDENANSEPATVPPSPWLQLLKTVLSHLPLVGPFMALSFVSVVYFVLMKYFNDKCRINMWGYNSFDQVMLPLYLNPTLLVIDLIKPLKGLLETGVDREESFREAFKGMIRDLFIESRGMGFLHMFTYRLLQNTRAMGYSYIAIVYDLTDSYLELTLIRVVLSWLASAVVIFVVPSFILAQQKEREKVFDVVNLLLKVVGTGAIVGSLAILNHAA